MGSQVKIQVCENGHSQGGYGVRNFCAQCGKPVLHSCPTCSGFITLWDPLKTGGSNSGRDSVVDSSRLPPPAYCANCGKPFPWTENTLLAANEVADQIEDINSDDREVLKGAIRDLVTNTPAAPSAGDKIRRIMSSANKHATDILKDILTNVISETLRRSIFGP